MKMQKIAIGIALIAAFAYYVTFAPANKYLIDIKPLAYRSVLIRYKINVSQCAEDYI